MAGREGQEEVAGMQNSELDVRILRPDRSGIRVVLGNLEADVMEVIWARPSGPGTTVRDVFEVLGERRRIAYTTVMGTMARLARKNLLRAEKAARPYVYYPNFTHQELLDRFTSRILEKLLLDSSGAANHGSGGPSQPPSGAGAPEGADEPNGCSASGI